MASQVKEAGLQYGCLWTNPWEVLNMANERILVVDDEHHIVRLCTEVLTSLGYTVEGVTDGLQALARLQTETYDLLVVDVKMPNIDGLAVLRQGRELDPNLTTIVITGYGTMDRAIEALHAGARGFIPKPFDYDQLTAAVQEALAQRRKEQEHTLLQAQLPVLEIGQALMADGNVSSLAKRLLEVIVHQMGATRGMLMLLDKDASEMTIAATIGLPDKVESQVPVLAGQGAVSQVLHSGEISILDSQAHGSLEPPLQALVDKSQASRCVLVPLQSREKNVGILAFSRMTASRSEAVLTSTDLNLLAVIGGQIAIALENVRLYALEQARAAALDRALQQQRELTRLKSEFIQNVSHELRTPLALIHGYAELLTSGALGKVDDKHREPLQGIVQRTNHLRILVDDIITMLANESRELRREPVLLNKLVSASLASFQTLAARDGLTLDDDLAPQVSPVSGDKNYLRTMIDHLLDNALKFTPSGGKVTVKLQSTNKDVVLRVIDTGIGIAAEQLERVFDRFYQVNGSICREFAGWGLGLALVKEIAEAHGGTVTVKSQLGKGSTFTVRLPTASGTGEKGHG
jgi:signal transduction histidine kinase/DNA-binding response OmpR family regulator